MINKGITLIGLMCVIVLYACDPKKQKADKWLVEEESKFTADSLQGHYIPQNIEDCYKELDKLWDKKGKEDAGKLTQKDFIETKYTTAGMWLRNNWRLWGGSRLTLYFNNHGLYNAENISWVILGSYYKHLTGSGKSFEELIVETCKWEENIVNK